MEFPSDLAYHGAEEQLVSTQIARIGKTIAVEIPEDLLRDAKLSVGDSVEWSITPSGGLALHGSQNGDSNESLEAYRRWSASEIESGLSDLDKGDSVPNEKVIDWLRSWGSKNELPPPLKAFLGIGGVRFG